MLDRVNWGPNLLGSSYRQAHIQLLTPMVYFLYVEKFVVVVGGGWFLKVDFSVKLYVQV